MVAPVNTQCSWAVFRMGIVHREYIRVRTTALSRIHALWIGQEYIASSSCNLDTHRGFAPAPAPQISLETVTAAFSGAFLQDCIDFGDEGQGECM